MAPATIECYLQAPSREFAPGTAATIAARGSRTGPGVIVVSRQASVHAVEAIFAAVEVEKDPVRR